MLEYNPYKRIIICNIILIKNGGNNNNNIKGKI